MFIKSLVLDGFKSYGHRTEITGFDSEFNAITGLNGTGKSNILDAICFVLGITNLSHVRATNLQDLIYKCGQCGVTKATVSINFDNKNPKQCPVGFENIPEITISRQVMMGGKTKYLINGATVTNKKVQDLFCSVQLNVNNPNFLIMQGKITKVLNMKPTDILAMVEETSGTRMYEVKRQSAKKTIEQKDAKLAEIRVVINEELAPRLEKFREERAKYVEFKSLERDLEHMLVKYHGWEVVSVRKKLVQAKNTVEDKENKIKELENCIVNNEKEIEDTEGVIQEMMKKAQVGGNENLHKAEGELKDAEKIQAKTNSSLKSIKDEINTETEKKSQLEKYIVDEQKTLESKQVELDKVQGMFQKLKDADKEDSEALVAAQKRYEALSAGMEINEEGEAETLLEQLMKARQEATQANTEMKKAQMRLTFCKTQLAEKEKQRFSNAGDTKNLQKELEAANQEVNACDVRLKKLNFNEGLMNELQGRRQQLLPDVRALRNRVDMFEARRPHTQFRYRDPEPNFNKNRVLGVVCRLFTVKDANTNYALEIAAGGRLYNVVIDTEATGKKLLQNGDLQIRTTFIPLNKIKATKISQKIVQIAQNLEGVDNVQPALDLIQYDKKLQIVMEMVFGNVLVCKDINVANRLAFDDRIRRKCVTIEGDVVDPAGTLSGGAPPKEGSVLTQLNEMKILEEELAAKETELAQLETKINEMRTKQQEYDNVKQRFDIKNHEIALINQRLQQTSDYRHREEIANLQKEINELTRKIETCKESEDKYQNKAQELEGKVKNSKGGRDKQIKEAEKEMNGLKAKADKSRKEWKQREKEYEIFNGEIRDLKNSLDTTREQIVASEEAIKKLKEKYKEIVANSQEIHENVATLQSQVKQEKAAISEKNKDIQKKNKRKEELRAEITKFEVQIKEQNHHLNKLKEDCKKLKAKQSDCERRAKNFDLKEVEKMTEKEGQELENSIRVRQEKKNSLARTINTKQQSILEQQEQEYNELKKKQKIVEQDRRKLLTSIENLDKKKVEVLQQAYEQISKDFGSIFGTLLPGANAKLIPPIGQTCLQGLEIKVALGDVWKESLTELSGGQRSLAALSLILSMLLYKPAPLYILDEVDAALDLAHTQNIGQMLKTHFRTSQFVIVSLKEGMFSNANVLFKTQFVDGVSTVTRTTNRH